MGSIVDRDEKGNISLNKLSNILKERQTGLMELSLNEAKEAFGNYDEWRNRIEICEQIHGIWKEVIAKENR